MVDRSGEVGFGRSVVLCDRLSSETRCVGGSAVVLGSVGVGNDLFDDRGGMMEMERIVVGFSTDESRGWGTGWFEFLETSTGRRLVEGDESRSRGNELEIGK